MDRTESFSRHRGLIGRRSIISRLGEFRGLRLFGAEKYFRLEGGLLRSARIIFGSLCFGRYLDIEQTLSGGQGRFQRPAILLFGTVHCKGIEVSHGRGIPLEVFLVEKLSYLLLFGLDEQKNVVVLVDPDEQLLVHTLLHGHDELASLDEFSDGLFTVEPPLDGHLHRVGDLLDLAQTVLIDQSLGHVDGRPRTYCGDGRLLLGVFENEPDDGVDVPDGDVEFVVEVEQVVELVVNHYVRLRHVLWLIPEVSITSCLCPNAFFSAAPCLFICVSHF